MLSTIIRTLKNLQVFKGVLKSGVQTFSKWVACSCTYLKCSGGFVRWKQKPTIRPEEPQSIGPRLLSWSHWDTTFLLVQCKILLFVISIKILRIPFQKGSELVNQRIPAENHFLHLTAEASFVEGVKMRFVVLLLNVIQDACLTGWGEMFTFI